MSTESPIPRSLDRDFVVMSPDKTAHVESADDGLYQRLDAVYGNFEGHELLALHHFDSDWTTWEIHPHGDEVVILLSGNITFVLRLPDGESSVGLSEPGNYVIVPHNVWHTARTDTSCSVLFLTPGQGTQNTDSPPA